MSLDTPTYQERVADPRWQRKRNGILLRDDYTCTCCHRKDRQLEVHHLDYIKGFQPWEYPDDMLVTLCDICHGKEKNRGKLEMHLANTFKMQGFFISDLMALSSLIETNTKFTQSLIKVLRDFQSR